jgi:hypothetical protein
MIKELFEEKFGFTLGERIGTKSSYGEAYVMPTKSKIVKIFYAKSDDLANREIAITTIMGLEGVGPKLFNAGKLDDKSKVVQCRQTGRQVLLHGHGTHLGRPPHHAEVAA